MWVSCAIQGHIRFGGPATVSRHLLHSFRYLPVRTASTQVNAYQPAKKLDLLAIDKRWKEIWKGSEVLAQSTSSSSKEKAYVLPMFPYPSGTLHMGHVRVYTISDVLARFKQMKGYDVLHPMGWDAFGLPAENAAIERGIHPEGWTKQNIANMRDQLKDLGIRFDWDTEVMTCSPEFYKHTQKLFLMLHEKGLAYQAEAVVNYDPIDKTVLANEQVVDANGCSWRSGAKVEKRELKQWFFRITSFKEALLKDLDSLSGSWPDRILTMQRHWLGKSRGALVPFKILTEEESLDIEVFTTRPDTLHGVQYIALSTSHPVVKRIAATNPELQEFIDSTGSLPPETKAGFKLPGVKAVNQLCNLEENPHLPSSLPVYVAPYVLPDYGEGAVMGVPGHDSRDFGFWKENAPSEPIVSVVVPLKPGSGPNGKNDVDVAFSGHGQTTDICGSYSKMPSKAAGEKIINDLKGKGSRARFAENWRLRDWLISRQRYWGAPIPIIHCDSCGAVPVPASQLPVELPAIPGSQLKDKTGNPLESANEWLHTECPSCKGPAKRDTDTMDTFVDSSWYFLRFLDPRNNDLPVSPAKSRPVDIYIGGIEHAILHLLYSRFIFKFLANEGMIENTTNPPEPFLKLLSQGMVHGRTYSDPKTGRFLRPGEVDLSVKGSPVLTGTQIPANISFEKMSKSKYNGVDPNTCIASYGADATRAHVLFSAPVSEVLEWDETKIIGIQRWFSRIWKALSENESNILLMTHNTISSVSYCLEKNQYGLNTVISDLIKLTNAIAAAPLPAEPSKSSPPAQSFTQSHATLYIALNSLLRMLAPIAPAFASECWEVLHKPLFELIDSSPVPSVFSSPWPSEFLSNSDIKQIRSRGAKTVAVQVNGKLRFTASVPPFSKNNATAELISQEQEQEWILSHVLATKEGKIWLQEKNDWDKRKRVLVVGSGKVVNIVF
ncbi:leucyl-tRNA synthetase [Nannizzia gypsea CBS 118893]|uniref:leucine--tRNA ligase n=1 Tax=Arthroderma gypseum (strain ATCC MYA-4604 / CBS 118893) TaxID=535722 RepID=E4UZF6_ARTGP|nr:leucyl-tRNA synthetase [Nannizzia gypsea CBS 118893]EFR03486.1 leucyl-tRNA synthetase [Nannizzia gypsea CBS 118893]